MLAPIHGRSSVSLLDQSTLSEVGTKLTSGGHLAVRGAARTFLSERKELVLLRAGVIWSFHKAPHAKIAVFGKLVTVLLDGKFIRNI